MGGGLRGRSDQRSFKVVGALLGVISGYYLFHDIFAKEVAAFEADKKEKKG
jgi:hypothetical protein